MKKQLLILFAIIFSVVAYAQNSSNEETQSSTYGMVEKEPLVKYFKGIRVESGYAYNMFIGPDADLFKTTVKGFGSGFFMDIFAGRPSIDVITIGTDKFNTSIGLGYSIAKYRFQKNLVFDLDQNNNTTVVVDPDPNHDYVNTFFGYGKSKLVYGSIFTPLFVNFTTENLFITVGGFSEFYLSGKHKRKYFDKDGEKVKEKIPNSNFQNYNINKMKFGATAAISHKNSGFGVTATYFITPFFDPTMGPEINELRVGIYYKFINFSELMPNSEE